VPVSTENVFMPEHRDLSECVSSLPKPDCGSEARGDWPQMALFGVLVAALVFIGWRIVRTTRKRPRTADDT
jgi:hypothetical protein